jgi:hypothetical protein
MQIPPHQQTDLPTKRHTAKLVTAEYKRKEKRNAYVIHSWTHEKEISNALLYMGIMNADPHPSDTFQVTLK